MHILLVAATPYEVQPLHERLERDGRRTGRGQYTLQGLHLQFLITGVGTTATTYALTKALTGKKYELVINAGVAGSYRSDWTLGTVVNVVRDRPADLGVEEADGSFTDVFELGLTAGDSPPYTLGGWLHNPAAEAYGFLPTASGATVQRVHGTAKSIAAFRRKYPAADVESMEGAAVAYVCRLEQQAYLQIRALSNYVEPRNRDGWELGLAIKNLTTVLYELLQSLAGS